MIKYLVLLLTLSLVAVGCLFSGREDGFEAVGKPRFRPNVAAAATLPREVSRVTLVLDNPGEGGVVAVSDETDQPVGYEAVVAGELVAVSLDCDVGRETVARISLGNEGSKMWGLNTNLEPRHAVETFSGLRACSPEDSPVLYLRDYRAEVTVQPNQSVEVCEEQTDMLWVGNQLTRGVRLRLLSDEESGDFILQLPAGCAGWGYRERKLEPQLKFPMEIHSTADAVVTISTDSLLPLAVSLTQSE